MDFIQFVPLVTVLAGAMCLCDLLGALFGQSVGEFILKKRFSEAAGVSGVRYFTVHCVVRYICCVLAVVVLPLAELYSYDHHSMNDKAEWPVIAMGLAFFALLFVLLALASYWHGAVLAGDRLFFAGIAPWQVRVAPVADVTMDEAASDPYEPVTDEDAAADAPAAGEVSPKKKRKCRFLLYNIHFGEECRYTSMLCGLGKAVRHVAPKAPPLAAVHFGQVVTTHVVEAVSEAVSGKGGQR
ncbi:hypothetical protein N1030_15185 [Desulfovibrio mangrovi]|uniref:hypothetical protein n=1 Tax=Desulfovibrio mangrovi TaxID=2976983 RepID=UPI0022460C70|nr:hypothetical protein [Desulfovibrio mangrovi]UZP66933.1 hypothetical protein N1030_15185 [Desulfovibrio mangrovi]